MKIRFLMDDTYQPKNFINVNDNLRIGTENSPIKSQSGYFVWFVLLKLKLTEIGIAWQNFGRLDWTNLDSDYHRKLRLGDRIYRLCVNDLCCLLMIQSELHCYSLRIVMMQVEATKIKIPAAEDDFGIGWKKFWHFEPRAYSMLGLKARSNFHIFRACNWHTAPNQIYLSNYV